MIHYLKHTGIDKHRWDDCIDRSFNRRIYAYSWYLDLVCPGWEALVEDDYIRVFPLTWRRKWGINYLFQPFFTQQLGIFSPEALTVTHINGFIRTIPHKFRFAEINLNSGNNVTIADGVATLRYNHEICLDQNYEMLCVGYSQNTRRNIRKAVELEVCLGKVVRTDDLISLFRENFGKKEGKLRDADYETIRKIISFCLSRKMGYVMGAYSDAGILCAAAFFLFDRDRAYFLFAASSPEARENGAMFMLIDRFIADNAQKQFMLDFEGGNDPNLGRFYKSFGATVVSYPALRINHLPGLAELVLYFTRKLRP